MKPYGSLMRASNRSVGNKAGEKWFQSALTRVRSVANFPIGGGRMNVDSVTAVNEGVTTMVVGSSPAKNSAEIYGNQADMEVMVSSGVHKIRPLEIIPNAEKGLIILGHKRR